jgi:Putative peptidoglycan binding domain/D-alanyl-D-alanine carboxypeptidase
METLKTGLKGKLVSFLQQQLTALGYAVQDTGEFNAATEKAVKKFQTEKGLVSDGKVGYNTWVMIYRLTVAPRSTSSRIERHNDIMHLHPLVRKAVVAVYVQLRAEGIPFRIFEAYRFPERQADLFAQGRTKPGNIVTHAQPWSSYHQYGLAVDFVLFINNEWSWSDSGTKAAWWKRMHELGARENLMRLNFETPHLQIMGTSSGALREGRYPEGGDDSWGENLSDSIAGWSKQPPAPPQPLHGAVRPPIH